MSTFISTLLLVPISIKLAHTFGVLDQPGPFKIHKHTTPRLGGLAIFVSTLFISSIFMTSFKHSHIAASILILSSIVAIFVLGLIDDLKTLKARHKFTLQMMIVLFAIVGLYLIHPDVSLIYFGIIYLFILGFINSFNLIDGMDGLASALAIIISVGIIIIAYFLGNAFVFIGAALLAGASLGFLLFNLNPAKIFLGDCGSTFLGLCLALLVSELWLSSENKLTFLPLLLITSVPIFDTSNVILRRLCNRTSIFQGDRNHIYDLLLRKGYSLSKTLTIVLLSTLLLTISGSILFYFIESY